MRQKKLPKEIYLDKHRKCGIKVGDKVKVTRRCKPHTRGWYNSWAPVMNDSAGMLGTVTRDENAQGFNLVFEGNPELSGYCYPYFVLQKVGNKEDKAITRMCESQQEARALANFLWNEKQRHIEDIRIIDEDLDTLAKKWGVCPTKVKAFVRP